MNQDKIQQMTPLPMSKDVREAVDEIAVLTRQDVARIPEPVFRQRLLPILTHTDGMADLTPWQDLAGSVTREIDVIDGGGTVLFRVPSLFLKIPTGQNADPRNSYNEILSHAKLKTELHPRVGQAFLDDRLSRKMTKVEPDLGRLHQWNRVLEFYKLPLLPIPGKVNVGESEPKAPAENASSIFTGEDDEV